MRLLILIVAISLLATVAGDKDGPICSVGSTTAAESDGTKSCGRGLDNGGTDDIEHAKKIDALIAWVRSLGGFVDERIVIRHRDVDDPTSVRGMFVTGDVAEGERLFYIPLEAILYKEGGKACDSARVMAQELALGEKSKHAPFISVIKDEIGDGAGPPCFWSEAGRALLDNVLGQHLPPKENMQFLRDWRERCDHNPENVLSDKDVMLFATRAVRNMVVPIFVFANHRNRPGDNFRIDADDEGFGAVTTRDITKGEEIYYWYGLGAHGIFKDFGFIEQFPQRWVFDFGVDGQGIDAGDYGFSGGHVVHFDLDEVLDSSQESDSVDGRNSSFSVTWVKGGRPSKDTVDPPSQDTIDLLRSELIRLGTLRSPFDGDGTNSNAKVPREEKELIWQYHNALTFAISHAIQAATDSDTS